MMNRVRRRRQESSADVTPANARVTEDSQVRLTEDGEIRVTES